MKKIFIKFLTVIITAILLFPSLARGQISSLPEVMVGETKLETKTSATQTDWALEFVTRDDNTQHRYAETNSVLDTVGNNASNDFSVSFSANILNNQTNNIVISHNRYLGSTLTTKGWAFGFTKPASTLQPTISLGNGTTGVAKTGAGIFPVGTFSTNTWYNFTFVRQGNLIKTYVDGIWWTDISAVPTGPIYNAGSKVILGDHHGNNGVNSNLQVDNLRIFDRALNDIEITGCGNNDESACVNPLLFWKLDEGSGINALDSSSSDPKRDGTLKITTTVPATPLPKWVAGTSSGSSVGQQEVSFYGGFTGNEAVYNQDRQGVGVEPGQVVGKNSTPSIELNGSSSMILFPQPFYPPLGATAPNSIGIKDFSVSFWFKNAVPRGQNWEKTLFSLYQSGGLGPRGAAIVNAYTNNAGEGFLALYEWGMLDTSNAEAIPAPEVKDTKWHHLAVSRDHNSLESLSVYLDGKQIYSWDCYSEEDVNPVDGNPDRIPGCANNEMNMPGSATNHVTMGYGDHGTSRNGNDPTLYFDGNIDEVMMYDRPLIYDEYQDEDGGTKIKSEADDLYHGFLANSTDYLRYYKLSGESVGALTDSSSNNISGWAPGADWDYGEGAPIVSYGVAGTAIGQRGFDRFGFDNKNLIECINGIILSKSPYSCFVTNSANKNVRVLSSRTYIDNNPTTEISTLLYPFQVTVVGDAYLGSSDPNNFAFWGKNLVQGGTGSTASNESYWGFGNYALNPEAQVNLEGDKYHTYIDNVVNMGREAQVVTGDDISANKTWYLQGSNLFAPGNSEVDKYPEGKVWSVNTDGVGEIDLDGTYTYWGVGTLVIRNPSADGDDLKFNLETKLTPGDSQSRLGIMVVDDNEVIFSGNNRIQAAILCYTTPANPGRFTFSGDNVNLIGTFVGKNFDEFTTRSNIRFYYDKGLRDSAPPGFGNMNFSSQTPTNK